MAAAGLMYCILGVLCFKAESATFNCTFEEGFCGWKQSTEDKSDWIRQQGKTHSADTGPKADKTFGNSSGYYIYYEASGQHEGNNSVLLSPVVWFGQGQRRSSWCFSFWYLMHGRDMGVLKVYRVPSSGALSDGRVLIRRSGRKSSRRMWLEATTCLTDLSSSFRIAFEATRGSDFRSDIAIDDVQCQAYQTASAVSKSFAMALFDDFSGARLDTTAVVNQDEPHTFACEVQGIIPAATISWFLNDALQRSAIPSTQESTDGLVNATDAWTFTPNRTNHRQEIKCVASISELPDPIKQVMITLEVNGPPDIPVITGSALMTEHEPTSLTCQAYLGYPNDWSLVWSKGPRFISGPPTTSKALGNRFVFRSTLVFTPTREDDGEIITCSALRGSWTGPNTVGYFGPIDVQTVDVPKYWLIIIIGIILGVIVFSCIILNILRLLNRKRRKTSRKKESQQRVFKLEDVVERPVRGECNQDGYQDLRIPMKTMTSDKALEDTVYSSIPEFYSTFSRDQLTIVRELGQGAFGKVLLARAEDILQRGVVTLVAVRTPKDGTDPKCKEHLLQELKSMESLNSHANVIKLLGYCVSEDPMYVIVEYLSKGNLKDLLSESKQKDDQLYGNVHGNTVTSLTSTDLLYFAKDVADGMAYLSSQQCLHKDLAARSVLVGQDMVCKVSDFGFASDVMHVRAYERKSQGRIPLRWMALESVFDDVYTTESDVWSYGVLLWEIVTLGARPYPTLSCETMIAKLKKGYCLPRPKHCRIELYQVMVGCWAKNPAGRFLFSQISEKLEELLSRANECISLEAYQEHLYKVKVPCSFKEKI